MWGLVEYFSFEEWWSPPYFFLMAGIVWLYFYLIGPWSASRYPQEPKATGLMKAMFVLSAALIYFVHAGPVNLLSHLMFTFHMVVMSITYLIVPPMLILSIPAHLWVRLLQHSNWKKLRFFTHPIMSLMLFNIMFSVYHMPMVHDFVMGDFLVHRIYYFTMFAAALLMWSQIVSPVAQWRKLTDVKRMAYVFAGGMLLTPSCALIIFAKTPLFATFSDPNAWIQVMGYCMSGDPSRLLEIIDGPQALNLMNLVEDQQLGGILMKFVQEFIYGVILVYIFRQWFKREHADDDKLEAEVVV